MTIDRWASSLIGVTLGKYRLDQCIGRGGFGLVFQVKSPPGGTFAMKVLHPLAGPEHAVDFKNEGVLLRRLIKCSSVINLVDGGEQTVMVSLAGGGTVPIPIRYHVLVHASGGLNELLVDPLSRNALSWQEKIGLWRGAVKGVHQMHLKSIVHRDLKSDNCLLVVSGKYSEVRLTDLGRSKDCHEPVVHDPLEYIQGRGDLFHAPPEHLWIQGGFTFADFRDADLYGLGSILAELATGHPMTALAMTSALDAKNMGIADYHAGIVRDLATLRPQFRQAIEVATADVPSAIQKTFGKVLTQLCDPVPEARQPLRAPGRRGASPEQGLTWLLLQADILARQLAVAPLRMRYRRSTERTA